ncbi:hypothetical protein MLD38_030328 [Melastoma candidum]|uniref:Uncharacterized protein n=1 Tax=Melastoma candidum TaxID=119954 RepID=A0ACB9MLH8_9MYRT|nr:hypothetical protein MLD38_030328 [Melastoma candidum]
MIQLRWRNWFGGKPVISFQQLSNGRRKEELRLHTTSIDAALSVVRLATAIASITRTNDINCRKDSVVTMGCGNSMSDVVSTAATLVAAVCAEAAESVGAPRDLVASAVNSGFAAQMPSDVIDLTVSAATCLRGAATLRSRTTVGCRPQEAEVLLNSRTPLPVVMPTGEMKQRVVSIKLQKMRLLLIFARKSTWGAVLTSKKYTIVGAVEGAREARACHCIVLRTDGGDMKLMFKEENESRIWTSTVFRFLCNK